MGPELLDTGVGPEPSPGGMASPPVAAPPAPPATGAGKTPQPGREPLTGLVLRPGQALAYAIFVIVVNVGLQILSSSAGVQTAFRELVFGIAGPSQSTRLLVGAFASAAVTVLGYVVFIAPPIAIAWARRLSWHDAFGLRRFEPRGAVGQVAAVVFGGLAVTIGLGIVAQLFGFTPPNNTVRIAQGFGSGGIAMLLGYLVVGFIAPLAEEIAFRGVVFANFERAWGVGPAAAMSGLLFGIVHLQTLEIVPLGLIGVGLALVFARSRSLWVAVLAHGAYNAVVLAVAFSAAGLVR